MEEEEEDDADKEEEKKKTYEWIGQGTMRDRRPSLITAPQCSVS